MADRRTFVQVKPDLAVPARRTLDVVDVRARGLSERSAKAHPDLRAHVWVAVQPVSNVAQRLALGDLPRRRGRDLAAFDLWRVDHLQQPERRV